MAESQSQFVHWQNFECEAWYEITGCKTRMVPGSFHIRPKSHYEQESNIVKEGQSEVVDSTLRSA